MATLRAKTFDYSLDLDAEGRYLIGDAAQHLDEAWTAEHLVLAGLVRCSLTSLAYHGRRVGVTLASSRGGASGKITKRESDDRYAFVEIDVRLEVDFDAQLEESAVRELVAKGERDCFISASLAVKPRYSWRVNGTPL